MEIIGNSALAVINEDQSIQTVSEVIQTILDDINQKQWMIGDILVFLRFRAEHAPLAEFGIPEGEIWPAELLGFLDQRHFRIEQGVKDEILHWQRLTFEDIIVLYDDNRVMIWQKTGGGFQTDKRFDDYLGHLSKMLSARLNGKTLWSYYITSHTYPTSKRIEDVSWTTHFDNRNLAAIRARNTEHNPYTPERLAQLQLEELVDSGLALSTLIREDIKREKQEERGYKWYLPLPHQLKIKVGEEEKIVIQFEFHVPYSIRYIFFNRVGATFGYLYLNNVILHGNDLYFNKEKIGDLPLMDKDPDVDKAIIWLAGRMGWKIRPASSPPPSQSPPT
jgi:hypothetical protein